MRLATEQKKNNEAVLFSAAVVLSITAVPTTVRSTMTRDWARLTALLSQQGISMTLRTVTNAAVTRYWPPKRRFMQELLRQRIIDQQWDHEHGVETSGDVALTDVGIGQSAANAGNGIYRGVWIDLFRQAMRTLTVEYENFTFVDFGSGKGKAMLLASDYPFLEIIGIEFARPLHEVAVENIRRYQSPKQRCARLTAIDCDVNEYELPKTPLICFFFNPMATPQLEQLFKRIVASVKTHPRPIYVVYVNPRNVNEHRLAFSALSAWPQIAQHQTYRVFGPGDSVRP